MHDIERYGIGKSELATWRNAKRATLLFCPRGEVVALTLLADEAVIGRHTVDAKQVAEVVAGYTHLWHSAPNPQQRSLVTAFGLAGQGVDTNLPPHGPPKGWPPVAMGLANTLIHENLRIYSTFANEAPEV